MDFEIRQRFDEPPLGTISGLTDPAFLSTLDAEGPIGTLATHEIEPDHYADRLTASYRSVIRATDRGAERIVTGELKVHVPLVGGRVEKPIVAGLEQFAATQAEAFNRWLRARF